MSEYHFGYSRSRRFSAREVKRRDRICRKHGGHGFTHYRNECGEWVAWFSGPNLGHPFDRALERAVLAEVGEEKDGAS